VIGVLPRGGAFDRAFNQIWRPLAFELSNMTRVHWLVSFGRLKDGVSLEQAQSAMTAIGARIATDFPASNKGWGVIVERYADTLIGADMRRALLVLISATGLVLLIGCANFASLALTRGLSREREVVVRASLGARRGLLSRRRSPRRFTPSARIRRSATSARSTSKPAAAGPQPWCLADG